MKDRKQYFKGYNSGRKFDKSLNIYTLVAFALGMLVEFMITLIVL